MERERLYDVRQAAKYLTVSIQTIYKLIQTGDLPASRLGTRHCIRIEEKDLKEFKEDRKLDSVS